MSNKFGRFSQQPWQRGSGLKTQTRKLWGWLLPLLLTFSLVVWAGWAQSSGQSAGFVLASCVPSTLPPLSSPSPSPAATVKPITKPKPKPGSQPVKPTSTSKPPASKPPTPKPTSSP